MRIGLVFFLGVLVVFVMVLMNVGKNASSAAAPTQSLAEQRAAILAYTACDGGATLENATAETLKISSVQSFGSIRYVSQDTTLVKYAIPYKAQNGAEKSVDFNYAPATGKVNAENDDGL